MSDETKKWRLSHSQVNTLTNCSVQHMLEKRFKKPGRPHWSTIGGSAFHKIAEVELLTENGRNAGEVPEVEDALSSAITDALFESPYTEPDIRVSHTLPKGWSKTKYPNGADKSFLLDAIPVWLQMWRLWRKSIPFSLWFTPDGEPALEVELKGTIGGHPVVAYVDAIFVNNLTGELLLVDWKAGARHIEGSQQLGTYKVLLEQQGWGVTVNQGVFYYAREGQASDVHNLSAWSQERLDIIYRNAGRIIEQGLYTPNFDSCAYMCSVKDWCPWTQGQWSEGVPLGVAPMSVAVVELDAAGQENPPGLPPTSA